MEQQELQALCEHYRGSVLVVRYSTTPHLVYLQDGATAQREPLVISEEASGCYLLMRVMKWEQTTENCDDGRIGK